MVKVLCEKTDGKYSRLRFRGHAGFAKIGKDIVCAAASVLFINTINSLEAFTEDTPQIVRFDKKAGNIEVRFDSDLSDKAILLLDSMVLGFKALQKDYRGNLSIKIKEE